MHQLIFRALHADQALGAIVPVCWWAQETELLTAGFPCVDVSRAGARRGLDGRVLPCLLALFWPSILACSLFHVFAEARPRRTLQRTALVRHVFRLLKRAREDCRGVPWVLLENVSAPRPLRPPCSNAHFP